MCRTRCDVTPPALRIRLAGPGCSIAAAGCDGTRFTSPHGKYGACLDPLLINRRDVEKDVGLVVRRVFPVIGEVQPANAVCGQRSFHGRKGRVKDRIAHDNERVLVIFVPAPRPVRDDYIRLVFANNVANRKARAIGRGDLGIGISEEHCIGPEHLRGLLRRRPLHLAVLFGRNGPMPFLAAAQVQKYTAAALVNVLRTVAPMVNRASPGWAAMAMIRVAIKLVL